jgi:hypothetical protein
MVKAELLLRPWSAKTEHLLYWRLLTGNRPDVS